MGDSDGPFPWFLVALLVIAGIAIGIPIGALIVAAMT